jgi:hypothetical protein
VIARTEPQHRDEHDERLVHGRFVAGFEPGPVNGFDPAHAQRGSLRVPAGGAGVWHTVSILPSARRSLAAPDAAIGTFVQVSKAVPP